jgi:hypothetical protein
MQKMFLLFRFVFQAISARQVFSLCAILICRTSASCPAKLILLYVITAVVSGEKYKLWIILIVEECILLRLYTIKYDDHVTYSQLFIYVQTLHTSLYSQHVSAAMRHHQVKPNTTHQLQVATKL